MISKAQWTVLLDASCAPDGIGHHPQRTVVTPLIESGYAAAGEPVYVRGLGYRVQITEKGRSLLVYGPEGPLAVEIEDARTLISHARRGNPMFEVLSYYLDAWGAQRFMDAFAALERVPYDAT